MKTTRTIPITDFCEESQVLIRDKTVDTAYRVVYFDKACGCWNFGDVPSRSGFRATHAASDGERVEFTIDNPSTE